MEKKPFEPLAIDPATLAARSDPLGIDARAARELPGVQLVDVRRAPAFAAAQDMAEGATWRDPAEASTWLAALDPSRTVAVYCVHGHEVSRTAALLLQVAGLDARFVVGGYEAWKAAGLTVVPKADR